MRVKMIEWAHFLGVMPIYFAVGMVLRKLEKKVGMVPRMGNFPANKIIIVKLICDDMNWPNIT